MQYSTFLGPLQGRQGSNADYYRKADWELLSDHIKNIEIKILNSPKLISGVHLEHIKKRFGKWGKKSAYLIKPVQKLTYHGSPPNYDI